MAIIGRRFGNCRVSGKKVILAARSTGVEAIEAARNPRLAFPAVIALAIALRWEQIGRLSLAHFDEGVFVSGAFGVWLHGMWHFPLAQPLQAPPLFPWMLAGTFGVTGMTLPAMGIYLSAALGVATVAVYFALLRRLYGGPFALAGTALLAASDLHVAFSRMALTDVPLTFWFVAGAYCLARVAECSRLGEGAVGQARTASVAALTPATRRLPAWALAFGLAVGAAWNTKYNGWMLVAIAATTWLIVAARGSLFAGGEGSDGRSEAFGQKRTALAIAFSAVVGAACFVPWYRHVERTFDGGYGAVVSNHLRYAGGFAEWPGRAHRLAISLSAFRHYGWLATLLATTGGLGAFLARSRRAEACQPSPLAAAGVAAAGLVAALILGCDAVLFFLAAAAIFPALVWGRWQEVFFAVWAGAFLVLTPFYHPYTRLLVPALPAVIGLALWLAAKALGLIGKTQTKHAAEQKPRGGSRDQATRLGRRFLTAGCATALLTALIWHPLGWLPSGRIWQRWSTTHSYRAVGDAVEEEKLPRDATVFCLGVPAMPLYIEREWSPIEFVPVQKVLGRVSSKRDCYLAVDSWGAYGENHELALASVEQRLQCLDPIAVVPNDLNLATLLDYLEPAELARHLSNDWPALHVADAQGREVVFPAKIDQPYAEVIVLYRIDRQCLADKRLE